MSDDFNRTPLEAIPEILDEDTAENEAPDESNNNALNSPRSRRKTKAGRKRELLAVQKLDCLKHLRQSVDTLIYTELFILYYMDCSFFRLAIRGLTQLFLFSSVLGRAPLARPYLGGVFFPNIICLFLHIFSARPEAGEAMRGYLHGGVILDLIGQKETKWKLHFILLDILVFVLQCFIVGVNTECRVLEAYLKNKEYKNPSLPEEAPIERSQDHDAEERGVYRVAGTTSNDIELQDLSGVTSIGNEHGNLGEEEEQHSLLGDHLLRDPKSREDELQEWLDMHYSGIAVTAEFHILHTLRNQYRTDKTRAQMVQTALATGSSDRPLRLAAVSDMFARAMEAEARNND